MSMLLNLDEIAGPATPSMLPEPPEPNGWSIVTLARHLCLPPHVVLAAIDENADIRGDRYGHSFVDAGNWPHGDVYLWLSAAERLADQFPAGVVARAIVADPALLGQVERVGGPALYALAKHLVDFAGGAA